MSNRQFFRKIKNITGLSLSQYLKEYRLNKARSFLENGEIQALVEAAHAVGFDTPHYFSTIFTKRFGKKYQDHFYKI